MLSTRNGVLTRSRLRRLTSWPGGLVVASISTALLLVAINYVIVTCWAPSLHRMPGKVDVDVFRRRTSRRNISEDADHWRQKLSSTALTQQERLQRKVEFCRDHPKLESDLDDLTPEAFNSILVEDKTKSLFCYIAKVACTSWKQVLIYLSGKTKASDPQQIRGGPGIHHSRNLVSLSNFSMKEIRRKLKIYSKYMFVRHPFTRLLSAYMNKFVNTHSKDMQFPKKIGSEIIKRYRVNPSNESLTFGRDVTFEEFVKYLLDFKSDGRVNEHWDPYHTICLPCVVNYNFIGKYETMDADVREALARMGAGNITFPKSNASKLRTIDLLPQYLAKLTPNQISMLYTKYSTDFVMFDYQLPQFNPSKFTLP